MASDDSSAFSFGGPAAPGVPTDSAAASSQSEDGAATTIIEVETTTTNDLLDPRLLHALQGSPPGPSSAEHGTQHDVDMSLATAESRSSSCPIVMPRKHASVAYRANRRKTPPRTSTVGIAHKPGKNASPRATVGARILVIAPSLLLLVAMFRPVAVVQGPLLLLMYGLRNQLLFGKTREMARRKEAE